MIIYVSTADNKLAAVEVDERGNLVKILQTVDPVVRDVPETVPEKGPAGLPPIATEWISRHPKFPLLYALTSFWNNAQAVVTTYSIRDDGSLTKLGSAETGGYQAAHGIFSADGSTYVIAHHNGGKLAFFDSTKPEAALEKPMAIIDPPELIPGTRAEPKAGSFKMADIGLPSLHGASYAPNGKYLLCADPIQNAVFTYAVDERGRPTSDEAVSQLECRTDKWAAGYALRFLLWMMKVTSPRPRRVAVHPNGRYLYVIHEMSSYVQVYAIDDDGRMQPECLQEISCYDPALREGWISIGVATTLCSELEATDEFLLVSNRGMSLFGGRCESGVRVFTYKDGGRRLEDAGTVRGIPAAVRHFSLKDDVLWVGMNSSKVPLVQKYVKKEGKFQLTGQADVGMDVWCVAP